MRATLTKPGVDTRFHACPGEVPDRTVILRSRGEPDRAYPQVSRTILPNVQSRESKARVAQTRLIHSLCRAATSKQPCRNDLSRRRNRTRRAGQRQAPPDADRER